MKTFLVLPDRDQEAWLQPLYEQSLVSVIIPIHNQERFFSACIESIFAQDYRPIEIVIVDDGSSGRTGQIIEEFRRIHKEGIRIKSLYQSQHGAPHARNQGCMQAQGEFIQFLDADDLLCPGKLSRQVKVFKNDNSIDVVYGDGQYLIDFEGAARKGRVISIGSSSDIVESLLFGYWLPPFAYLTRRSAVRHCGPWDETLPAAQDFEYFLRMATQGCNFDYDPSITGLYRKHSFTTISERSTSIRERARQRILAQAEQRLRGRGTFNERITQAIVENHRRIARQTYKADRGCFELSLCEVTRLCPDYLPKKRRARLISSIIGFRNYERLAAVISSILHKKESDWF